LPDDRCIERGSVHLVELDEPRPRRVMAGLAPSRVMTGLGPLPCHDRVGPLPCHDRAWPGHPCLCLCGVSRGWPACAGHDTREEGAPCPPPSHAMCPGATRARQWVPAVRTSGAIAAAFHRRLLLAPGWPLPPAGPCPRLALAPGWPLPPAGPCPRLALAPGWPLPAGWPLPPAGPCPPAAPAHRLLLPTGCSCPQAAPCPQASDSLECSSACRTEGNA
jgi:hypothetical protein